jgi:hypothetical protein
MNSRLLWPWVPETERVELLRKEKSEKGAAGMQRLARRIEWTRWIERGWRRGRRETSTSGERGVVGLSE